jgi:hypothetical protein
MSGVAQYLDCGCAIMKDGSRSICPTCAAGGPGPAAIEREMFVLLDREQASIESAMPLGGGLVCLYSQRMAQTWRDLHTAREKRERFAVFKVKITGDGVPLEDLPPEEEEEKAQPPPLGSSIR